MQLPGKAKIAWLDGLRGIAALQVYWHHHQQWAHTVSEGITLERSFGYKNAHQFATLPIIRLLFSGGHFAVAIFFLVSGYGLSIKSLNLICSGRHEMARNGLVSSVFRRWLRLFGPVVLTTFIYLTLWHAFSINIYGVQRRETWAAETFNWLQKLRSFTFVFDLSPGSSGYSAQFDYNVHLWTIPVELKGSMIVYISLIALSQFSSRARWLWQTFLIIYFIYVVDGWYGAMFLMGMAICELHLATCSPQAKFQQHQGSFEQIGWWFMFVSGLVLGGVPHTVSIAALRQNPGWYYLSFVNVGAVTDYKWFYLLISGTLVVTSIPYLPMVKRLLETKICRWLGRISYGLYLVHGPLIWTIGNYLYKTSGCWSETSPHTPAGFEAGRERSSLSFHLGLEFSFLTPHILLLPLTLLLAEMVTRYIDNPVVSVSNWIYEKSLANGAHVS